MFDLDYFTSQLSHLFFLCFITTARLRDFIGTSFSLLLFLKYIEKTNSETWKCHIDYIFKIFSSVQSRLYLKAPLVHSYCSGCSRLTSTYAYKMTCFILFYFYTYNKIPIVRIMYVNKLFVVFIIKYLIIFFVPYIFHLKLLIANKIIINYFTLK